MNKCLHCKKETKNPKYCSRSCSATATNATPKRKLTRTCLVENCTSIVKTYRHQRCAEHWDEYKNNHYKNRTLGEYQTKNSVQGKNPSWVSAHVRAFARSWLRHLTKLPCAFCGYDKHVELAHIRAISSFTSESLLSEINSEDNVIQLCPNCHWEFDNLPR